MMKKLSEAEIKAILSPIGDDEGWLLKFHDVPLPSSIIQPKRQKEIFYNNEYFMTVYWDPATLREEKLRMKGGLEDRYNLMISCFCSGDGHRLFRSPQDIYSLPNEVIYQLRAIIASR